MKRWLSALLLAAAPTAALAEPIRFVTEEYPPFNYSRDGEIAGIAVEQVRRMAEAAGIDYSIEIMPWARAFALAEQQPTHCVFITGFNRERGPRFQWILPLLRDQMVLVKRKDARSPANLLEARTMRVGSQRGDFAVEALEQVGFENIDLATDIELTIRKLLGGRIDLMPTSFKTFEKMRADGLPVEKALLLAGQVYGIACNPGVPTALVERLQKELDRLVQDGTQDRIFAGYGLRQDTRTAEKGEAR